MAKKIIIELEDNEELEAIRVKPLAADLATDSAPSDVTTGTSRATAKVTSGPNGSDQEADITYDF